MDRFDNRPEYHNVAAEALSSIIRLLANGELKPARTLMKFNIRQAYVMYRIDDLDNRKDLITKLFEARKKDKLMEIDSILTKELKEMKLDELDEEELLDKMFAYQTLAGIKPVQTFRQNARTFAMTKNELGME